MTKTTMPLKMRIREFLFHLWPKVLWRDLRREYQMNLRKVSVDQRKNDLAAGIGYERVSPWAFIRVKDERTTLLASLNSILPVINKGVIAYNECTDGSDKIIEQFCLENPGFIPFHYPYHVEPAGSDKYANSSLPYENTLAAYYNAALELVPKNEWLIKIDVDQIYLPEILEHSFYLPQSKKDYVSYSRLNVIRSGDDIKVLNYVRPNDHWLIFNDNLKFGNAYGSTGATAGEKRFYSYEYLKITGRNIPWTPECSSIHFPFEKDYRRFVGDTNKLVTFEEFMKQADKTEFSDELFQITEIVNSFENK